MHLVADGVESIWYHAGVVGIEDEALRPLQDRLVNAAFAVLTLVVCLVGAGWVGVE